MADGGCDWNAGVPACNIAASAMSNDSDSTAYRAEKALSDLRVENFDAAEATALQAGTPAFQSHPPFPTTANHTKPETRKQKLETRN